MSSSDLIKKRQDRANFIGTVTKQQAFNLGITNFLRGANQPATTSGLLSASDGTTDVTPNQLALTLATNLGLTDQILFFQSLVNNGVRTSTQATQFNQVALSNPETAIQSYNLPAPIPSPEPPSVIQLIVAQWATYLNGNGADIGRSIAFDSFNNIYLTGAYASSTGPIKVQNVDGNGQIESSIELPVNSSSGAVFLIKYNSVGQAQWATYINGSSTDVGFSITIDTSNDICLTGSYNNPNPNPNINLYNASGNGQSMSSVTLGNSVSGTAVFLVKYDMNGQVKWATCFEGTANDVAKGVVTDSQNNIYITGQYAQTPASGPLYLKDVNGNTQSASLVSLPVSVSATNYSVFLIKYDTNGIVQWATALNGSGIGDIGNGVAIDSDDNVYITGTYVQTVTDVILKNVNGTTQVDSSIKLPPVISGALFLIKYNSDGEAQWATYLESSFSFTEVGNSVQIDSSDNVYVVGTYASSVLLNLQNASSDTQVPSSIKLPATTSNSSAGFLMKYNKFGEALWATCLDGTSSDFATSLAIDTLNNIYMAGVYTSSSEIFLKNADGDGQAISNISLPISINQASFVIKYNSNGIAQSASYFDGDGNDQTWTINIDSQNNIYISGQYSSTALLPLQNTTSVGYEQSSVKLPVVTNAVFLIKYNQP
jgi:hypothetical protein